MFNASIYEMTSYNFNVGGNVFKIDGKPIGIVDYHINKKRISIRMFSTKKFGNNSRKGHGTVFYNMLIEYVKTKYGCTECYAVELILEGNEFFRKMGLNNKNKNPDYRWGSI